MGVDACCRRLVSGSVFLVSRIPRRAVHSGGGGGGGRGGSCPRQENPIFFPNIVLELAELFLVAILVRNHKKID